jgi:hypothetical protein
MNKLVQYIKTNNAFARRDYWVAVPVATALAMMSYHFARLCVDYPRNWQLNLTSFAVFSSVLLLPLFYNPIGLVAVPAVLVIALSGGDENAPGMGRYTTFEIAIMSLFAILSVIPWARLFRGVYRDVLSNRSES